MRLEGQHKGGFFPCPVPAIDAALARIVRTADLDGHLNVFDPCAGEGAAIEQIAQALKVQPAGVWACELEDDRSIRLNARLAGGRVLTRCDFTRAEISSASFSLAWVNPPFDSELGGGRREELTFLRHASSTLVKGGLLVFVCPEHVLGNWDVKEHILGHYERVSAMPFPSSCRKFREAITFGVRRGGVQKANPNEWQVQCDLFKDEKYALVRSGGPRRFQKGGLSDTEIAECMLRSPLMKLLYPPKPEPMPAPPLELSRGQMALVLAGGMLNGVVQRQGEPPILIKATPYKESYISSETEEERGSGDDAVTVTVRETSERLKLKVRALTPDGTIKDLV